MDFNSVLHDTYEIEGQIGAGGGGTVYKAWHKRLGKEVVLKKIHHSGFHNEEEKEILKNLKHSYLPQVLDFLEVEDGVFTVLDYIPGASMDKFLKSGRKFTPKQVVRYAVQLCEVVDYLHRQNPPIIHGDIKPANIMLTPEDNICLIDFNISGVLDGKSMTVQGYTPGYASPEQAAAVQKVTDRAVALSQPVDARSDIYSIAATLYHLLTGIKPDRDFNKIRRPSELDDRIGEGLSVILMKALNPDPRARFQSAEEMRKAFQELYRYESKYKRLIFRQELMFLSIAVCMGIGVLLFFFGRKELDAEAENAYVQTISLLGEAVERQDGQDVETLYEKARQMRPERMDACFQRTIYLYARRDYATCQEFIEGTILTEADWTDDVRMADIYFLLANCYFEQGDYKWAVVNYRTAILKNGENPDYYRDYAIALARQNELGKAKDVLQTARTKGLSTDDLLLVEGELKKDEGDFESAKKSLIQCISETDDDHVRMRAYVICDMVYRNLYDQYVKENREGDSKAGIEYLNESRALLEEARTRVGLEDRLLIYERLAQTYIDLDELTSDHTYGMNAISVLQDIIDQGWGSYITYNNISILYQKMGDLEQAEAILRQMEGLYPDQYNTYKRRALLEVEKQNRKDNDQREYGDFLKYYERAKSLYEAAPPAAGDTEMQLLDNLHKQLETGGWL